MIVRPFWAKAPPLRRGGGTGNADRDPADIGGLERERWPTSSVCIRGEIPPKERGGGRGERWHKRRKKKKLGGKADNRVGEPSECGKIGSCGFYSTARASDREVCGEMQVFACETRVGGALSR